MSKGTHLATWVTRETKERFAAMARHQGLSDSALLKRMVELALRSVDMASLETSAAPHEDVARASRLTVRLRPDDQALLRERASARDMAPATYVSVLVRSHLRSLAPLPKAELIALRTVTAKLSDISRNLSQIAQSVNQSGPVGDRLSAMLRVCAALRDHVKKLLSANLRSWEQGYADPGH